MMMTKKERSTVDITTRLKKWKEKEIEKERIADHLQTFTTFSRVDVQRYWL